MPDVLTTSCGASSLVPETSMRRTSIHGIRRARSIAQSGLDAKSPTMSIAAARIPSRTRRRLRFAIVIQQAEDLAGGLIEVARAEGQADVVRAQLRGDS